MIALRLQPLHAGAGVALVAADALQAPSFVRVARAAAAAAPVEVGGEVVRALHVHVYLLCKEERLALRRGRTDRPPTGPAPSPARGRGVLTSIRVGALRGHGGSDTVHPDPLHPQLLQLPSQVPLLPLQLIYLV